MRHPGCYPGARSSWHLQIVSLHLKSWASLSDSFAFSANVAGGGIRLRSEAPCTSYSAILLCTIGAKGVAFFGRCISTAVSLYRLEAIQRYHDTMVGYRVPQLRSSGSKKYEVQCLANKMPSLWYTARSVKCQGVSLCAGGFHPSYTQHGVSRTRRSAEYHVQGASRSTTYKALRAAAGSRRLLRLLKMLMKRTEKSTNLP